MRSFGGGAQSSKFGIGPLAGIETVTSINKVSLAISVCSDTGLNKR